jgi:MtN3 and saliva related transmembrane protein
MANEETMLADWTTLVGTSAAILTTASYIPQVRKTWATGETGDLSRNMLLILASGLALWVTYGVMQGDVVIVLANAVSLTLLMSILYIKLGGRGGPFQ